MSARLDRDGSLLIDPAAPFVSVDAAGYLYLDPAHEDVRVDADGTIYVSVSPYIYAGWLDADVNLWVEAPFYCGLGAEPTFSAGLSTDAAIRA